MQKHAITSSYQSESPLIMRGDTRLTRMGFLQLFRFLILIVLLSLTACNSELDNIEEKQMMLEDVESVEFSAMRPFEAWMLTPSMGTRSVDSEIAELIEYEKERFDERFSFVEKYFKFVPVPQWESAKVVSYNEEEADVFILCNNDFEDNAILNKLVLVITIRGDDHFSFIKMLPKDENLAVWMTAVNDGKNVHIEVHQREPDGIFVSQSIGFLTTNSGQDNNKTRIIHCDDIYTYIETKYVMFQATDDYQLPNEFTTISTSSELECYNNYGSGGGVETPPPAAGAGSIPGYTPPSFPSSGSSGGSTSGDDSGGSSYSGGSSNYGGSGSVGGGDNSGGGSVGGGGSSSGNITPTFPEGGLDLIPRPEYVEELPDETHPLIKSHTLNSQQLELLIQAFNDLQDEGCMQKALYDALIERNVKLNFGMLSNAVDPANYNPHNKSVKFRDNNTITSANLKEELFHAWQDVYYQGGIEQYGKDAQGNKKPGYVNVEFEAKVFKDLIMNFGGYAAFFKYETEEEEAIVRAYEEWIYDIKDDISILQDESAYHYWLYLFNEHNPAYASPKSNDFSSFHGLYDSLSNSNCF